MQIVKKKMHIKTRHTLAPGLQQKVIQVNNTSQHLYYNKIITPLSSKTKPK